MHSDCLNVERQGPSQEIPATEASGVAAGTAAESCPVVGPLLALPLPSPRGPSVPVGDGVTNDNPRRGTSTGAARLGAALADLAERHRQPGDPDPCLTCGLKKGTLANMAGQTMLDAMNVLAGIDGDAFGCHHGMENGEPKRPCVNWLIAATRATRDEVLAAIQSVMTTIPPNDDPENDPVGVYVAAWAAEHDPDHKLDSYQLARLWEKTGPHKISVDG